MILKAQAGFTSVTNKKTLAVGLDGGLEITGEIIPDTPLQHEMLVAVLGDSKVEPTCEVTYTVEPMTEKITFKVRFEHDKDVVAAANARLADRRDADDAGVPLHIHLEKKAAKEAAAKAAAAKE